MGNSPQRTAGLATKRAVTAARNAQMASRPASGETFTQEVTRRGRAAAQHPLGGQLRHLDTYIARVRERLAAANAVTQRAGPGRASREAIGERMHWERQLHQGLQARSEAILRLAGRMEPAAVARLPEVREAITRMQARLAGDKQYLQQLAEPGNHSSQRAVENTRADIRAAQIEIARYRRGDIQPPTESPAKAGESLKARAERLAADYRRFAAYEQVGPYQDLGRGNSAIIGQFIANRTSVLGHEAEAHAALRAHEEARAIRADTRAFAGIKRSEATNRPFQDLIAGRTVAMRTSAGNVVIVHPSAPASAHGQVGIQQYTVNELQERTAAAARVQQMNAAGLIQGLRAGEYVRTLPSGWTPPHLTGSSRAGRAARAYSDAFREIAGARTPEERASAQGRVRDLEAATLDALTGAVPTASASRAKKPA